MRLLMTVSVAFVAASLASAAPALPKKKDSSPKDSPADQPFVAEVISSAGKIELKRRMIVYINVLQTREVMGADGKVVKIEVTVETPVTRESTVTFDPKNVEITSSDGKVIESSEFPKKLKAKSNVIVSPKGKPIGADLLEAHRDAVILRVKSAK